ncbi:MAG: recombinase family protein [Candidatus Dojkabacteria bacterium]|nr:recombinase family protein [Candidatus Dojkabacteria bacterium]
MKYFIYCRKSTDEDNRQIQSIKAQETELIEYAKTNKLIVHKILHESKTAKEPGREIFNSMLLAIEKGEADGIIAWHPDRLARNSVDGGKIIYLMDVGLLKELKFPTYWADNTPQGKFTLGMAFNQSKYYVDNLSQNVKRGIREKLRNGEWPTWALLGYKNDVVNKKILPDPEKFDLVKRIFDTYALGKYTLQEISDLAKSWGLVGIRGKQLSKSSVQRILTNPFYAGIMVYNGKRYPGNHHRMISMGTFLQIQKVIKSNGKPDEFKKEKKDFAYTGLLTCGECGCAITAENQKGHTYYRCTKKKGTCKQKYIRAEDLEKQIQDTLDSISIDDEVRDLMLRTLKESNKNEYDLHAHTLEYWTNERRKLQERKRKLVDLFTDQKIDDVLFEEKRIEIENDELVAVENLEECRKAENKWVEHFEGLIIVANQAFWAFSEGDSMDRKLLLNIVGSNFVLMDKKLHWDWIEPFDILAQNKARSDWRRERDSNPR